jgi:NAD(P)H-hydrate epimerase
LLAEAGWHVSLALAGDPGALKGDAATMAGRWTGGVGELSPAAIEGCDLVVDGLLGAGLARAVEGALREVIEAVNMSGVPVCAIDMPSGVHGDTGQVLGAAIAADLTVTFVRLKPGHLLLPGHRLAGEVALADIGTPAGIVEEIAPRQHENGPGLWLDQFPWPRPEGHKYSRGHAVAVSGGAATTGAARLAARAALRVGAGLVTLACPPGALLVNAAHLTAIMTHSFMGAAALAEMLADRRKSAVLLGPGNGVTPETRENVLAALSTGTPCVLDADALTVFADKPGELFEALNESSVLTPHDGEFARLFPDLGEAGKLDRTRAAAERAGAVVLLKGADTVIAHPDGRAAINTNAPPDLATAGSGDVLAGLVLGLLAQSMPPYEATSAATWLHAEAAEEHGPGLIAEDLSEALPAVLGRLKGASFAPIV